MVVVKHGGHVRGQVVNGLAVRSQVGHLLDRSRGSRHLKTCATWNCFAAEHFGTNRRHLSALLVLRHDQERTKHKMIKGTRIRYLNTVK
jgi:hypothetical protein